MTDHISLNRIGVGQSLRVTSVGGEEPMRRRLEDLGLIAGTEVTCLMVSPLGDPRAYRIRGAVIALRKEDAEAVKGSFLLGTAIKGRKDVWA